MPAVCAGIGAVTQDGELIVCYGAQAFDHPA